MLRIRNNPMPLREKIASIRIIALIFFVALAGAVIMYMSASILPLSDSGLNYLFCTVVLIALGLAIPYWMLKLGLHEASMRNRNERELTLGDIPKDHEQLKKDKRKK